MSRETVEADALRGKWRDGNQVELLENGEDFFSRVNEAIAGAREEILIETFILWEDQVGKELHAGLLAAAGRGVRVVVTVDGFGSDSLSEQFVGELTEAGVRFQVYDPRPRQFGMRTNVFRRLHRKLTIIDGRIAFVGGINFSAEHIDDGGPITKQDYAVMVRGPLVDDIHAFARTAFAEVRRISEVVPPVMASPLRPANPPAGSMRALFVTRDNERHRTDIERHYLHAISSAKHRIIIANAYFLPGYRLLRDLRQAVERGVEVTLILQGDPDMPAVKAASMRLYDYLVNGGVRILECRERQLHGKVAVIDDEWATVGSSNLDPLSLSLNLEANVIIRDRAFNRVLDERLQNLMQARCTTVRAEHVPRRTMGRVAVNAVVFHFLRHFPAWAGWLPAHTPKLALMRPPSGATRAKESAKKEPA